MKFKQMVKVFLLVLLTTFFINPLHAAPSADARKDLSANSSENIKTIKSKIIDLLYRQARTPQDIKCDEATSVLLAAKTAYTTYEPSDSLSNTLKDLEGALRVLSEIRRWVENRTYDSPSLECINNLIARVQKGIENRQAERERLIQGDPNAAQLKNAVDAALEVACRACNFHIPGSSIDSLSCIPYDLSWR